MLCILYVNAIAFCLGIFGLVVERLMPAVSGRRWVWAGVIALTFIIPPLYRAQHNMPVTTWAPAGEYHDLINRWWLTASAVLLVWGIASVIRVAGIVYSSRRAQRRHGAPEVVDGVPVVVTDSLGPATVGFLRSRVLVPRWVLALPGAQRKYILRHEDEHRRTHDALLLGAASLLVVVMPWNVALWWQLRRLSLAVELDCDTRVVAALGNANAYGELLLKVAEAASRGPRLQPAFLGGMGTLEKRLTAMLAPAPLRFVQRLLLPALAAVLLFAVLSAPHPVASRGTHVHVSSR
jgi:beta-lactamase regulating signal transducer with metallopeptidase domain